MGLRTFATVRELLWYNCSAVCGSSAWWLYGGINGDLLQEDLGHTPHLPGLLQPEPLSLRQATADPCLHTPQETLKPSKPSLAQSLAEVTIPFPGSWCTQGLCLHPPCISGGYEVYFLMQFLPSYHLVGASPLPLDVWYFFLVGSNVLLLMAVQQLVEILVFLQKMSARPSTPPS